MPVASVPVDLNPVPNVIVYDVVPDVRILSTQIAPAGGTVVVYVAVAFGVTRTTLSIPNAIAVVPAACAMYPPLTAPVADTLPFIVVVDVPPELVPIVMLVVEPETPPVPMFIVFVFPEDVAPACILVVWLTVDCPNVIAPVVLALPKDIVAVLGADMITLLPVSGVTLKEPFIVVSEPEFPEEPIVTLAPPPVEPVAIFTVVLLLVLA